MNRYRLTFAAIAAAGLVVALAIAFTDSGDKAPGQATGQGMETFGGGWYVVSPAGQKIEGEADESTGGGYR